MYKQRLKEYIEKDVIYQDYKKQKEFESSDFDNFCILHCEDIEEALFDLEQLRKENKELQEKYNIRSKAYNNILLENASLHNKIDKLTNNLENSINSINAKLGYKEIRVENGRIANLINDYRIVRLKAIRMKCKELLEILKGDVNE